MRRKSIQIEGFGHGGQPIPAACRVDNVLMTGGVHGTDPATGQIAADGAEQVRLMFWQLGRILEEAGGSFDDVVKITVYLKDRTLRDIINEHWVLAFPDPQMRPSRHTLLYDHLKEPMAVQCDAFAIIK